VVGEIVGRGADLELIRAFLEEDALEPRCLVLEGEAGIGKSTLWQAGVAEASRDGCRLLMSRPAEVERGLAFAGLGDLLEPVLDDVLPSLSPPRRRALEIALLVADDHPHPVDPRAIGVAVRDALELLGHAGPSVLAIDDVQWLDGSSSGALSFALRRTDCPLKILLARRVAEDIVPSELESAVSSDALVRLPVGPLSVGALQTLLGERLDRVFSRPTLLRIHEAAGGNPFYALEISRALGSGVDPTQPLPLPKTLESLVATRLGELPDLTRDALGLVAAAGTTTTALLRSAGFGEDALEPALRTHVVESVAGAVRFTHPLLASVAHRGLSAERARALHATLADHAQDATERARHLALSSIGPDDDVALELDRAAALARDRGAVVTLAELAEHALRLTQPDAAADRHRRAVDACRAHIAAGDAARAIAQATELCERATPGVRRAEALALLGELSARRGLVESRLRLWDGALLEAAEDPGLRATIHGRLAYLERMSRGLVWAEPHARAAVELAEEIGDDGLRAETLATFAQIRFNRGEADGLRLAECAHELALATGDSARLRRTTEVLGHVLTWSADLDRARILLTRDLDEWSDRDELWSAGTHWYLALVELRAGRLAVASEHAETAVRTRVAYDLVSPADVFPAALVAAYRGRLDEASAHAAETMALTDAWGMFPNVVVAVRGFVDLWRGEPAAATGRFEEAEQSADAQGLGEPAVRWWRAEYAEALVSLERLDDAEELLADWDDAARRLDRLWVLAEVKRCRGLLAAARGELEVARSLFEEAVVEHRSAGDTLGLAQALLVLGAARRRSRQKRAARDAIAEALALFEECGAQLFAEKARAELGRIGGRTREEGLTPAEQRVAALVAEGRTNREVAAALVLGERTVETHLTHIYAKLGIRSRTELARVYEPVS
jgi:DNA-binding CsgD family transcriptional regulator